MKATYNKISEQLRRELSINLAAQKKRMGNVSINTVSSSCHYYFTSVKRWFGGTSLPDLPNLYMLADFFGCSIFNLIESEYDVSYYLSHQPNQLVTYADQFHFFLNLYSSPCTTFNSFGQLLSIIDNPIVQFLVSSFFRKLAIVREYGASGTELQTWVEQVNNDFAIPVSPASPNRFKEVFNQERTLCLYADFLRAAKYLHEHDAEDQASIAEYQNEHDGLEWFSEFRVPTLEEIRMYPQFYGSEDDYY